MSWLCLLVIVLGCSASEPKDGSEKTGPQRVLVVGWDGVRGDAVEVADTPNLDRLALDGGLSTQAQTHMTGPHFSAPGWTSVHTGVPVADHQVFANGVYDTRDTSWPTFHQRAREAGMRPMAAVVWGEVAYSVIGDANLDDVHWGDEDTVTDWVLQRIDEDAADVWFVHHDAPDHAGHDSGFLPDNVDYLAEIEACDTRLGRYLDAIEQRDESWLVMVTTDHGGDADGHGPANAANQGIFLAGGVIGSGSTWSMDGASHLDVHPTVIGFLGLDADERGLPGADRH